jgi:hypothetical protein
MEHQIQAQARLIEQLQSKGLFGFLQRRRIRKMELPRYIREDELRALNIHLKERVRELNQELFDIRDPGADTRQ